MKAVKQHKQQWEEEQFLQLLHIGEQALNYLNLFYQRFKIVLNLLLYIHYQLLRFLWGLMAINLLAERNNQLVRDEAWIYRHIK